MTKRFLALFCAMLTSCLCAAEIMIAEDGKALAGIMIPENAKPVVKFAAEELKRCLEKMTGASFVVDTKSNQPANFYLGFGEAEHFRPDEYVISALGKRIDIYGKDTSASVNLFNLFYDNPDKGTLSGVFNFLDSLGVRWPAPGTKHEFIPQKTVLKIQEGTARFKPVMADRQITSGFNFIKLYPDAHEYIDHIDEHFLWGIRNGVSTRNIVHGCHSEQALRLFKNKEWLAHPERWLQKKDGTRNKEYSCWTDPGTKEIWLRAVDAYFSGKTPVEADFDLKPPYLHSKWPWPFMAEDEFMIDPMDYGGDNDGRCYCSRCNEFRKKYPCPDDTEILWKFISEIAAHVQKKFPGKYISTLVYPPKKLMPVYFKVPGNVRVRICMSGPKEMNFPNRLAGDMKLIEDWTKVLGKDNIPLWCYQCASFGRTLPGVPDTYPHLIAAYIEKIKDLTAGIFLENENITHTLRNLDVYLFLRMAWDPSRNIDDELTSYFRAYYGPAAKEAHAFYTRLETNWNRLAKLTQEDVFDAADDGTGGMWKNKETLQKTVWGQVYTVDEMKTLDMMLSAIEKAAAADPACYERTGLLRKYFFDIMKSERREVMEKDEQRQKLNLEVRRTTAAEFPSESEWSKAKSFSLVSATRLQPDLKAGGTFWLLASQYTLFVRAVLQEPEPALSATDPSRKTGNTELWKDNDLELFFYAPKTKCFWQIVINDHGQWSSQTRTRVLAEWKLMPGLRMKTTREASSWIAEAAIPLSELKTEGGELRFNLCRVRNIKGKQNEYSTWSPLAMLGNWHAYDNFGTVNFVD